MAAASERAGGLRLLLRLDALRARGALRHPQAGAWAGVLLPLLLAGAGLAVAGVYLRPRIGHAEDAVLLGLLVAGAVAFAAHPVLFRPADEAFLRRLGFAPGALYAHRALRLLALSLGVALFFLLPFAASGGALPLPLAVGGGAALAAWGMGLLRMARAAERVGARKRPGLSARAMRDPELASAAPLVYAPLAPLLLGAAAAGWVGVEPGGAWLRLLPVAGLAAGLALLGARPFARALPRFAPRAAEMTFEPPPRAGEAGLVAGRGVFRLLPRGARAVHARDAALLGRGFRWAGRIVWPVAALSVVALARWGDAEGIRAWVAAAGGAVLAAQGMALVALGRGERGRTRWLDRALGLGAGARLLGRWAAGAGLAAWLVIPLLLVWGARSPAGFGWGWALAALATSGAAAAVSVAAAGR